MTTELLLEPFQYQYMTYAIWTATLVGGTCAFLSAYLMLKGLSLMGDALSHSIVPGVALAYIFSLPFSIGAFFSGFLAALGMLLVKKKTKLKEDTVIGIVFTTFFALGLLIISLRPMAVNLNSIILGNILTISRADIFQIVLICLICFTVLILKWKDFVFIFFDENYAKSLGFNVFRYKMCFFILLSATTIACLQAVGACLVIAMVVTPGTTAYFFTDRFGKLIICAVLIGSISSLCGAYLSYYIDASPGGIIVSLQTIVFLLAFLFSPKYGLLKAKKFSLNPKRIQ